MGGIVRGCGSRQAGAVYLTVDSSPWGMEIEHFLFCPPVRIDQETFGLSNIGVKIVQYETGNHVMDIVGQQHYPNVADVIEEGKRFGFSRRVPKTLNFSLLTPESRLMLLHHRAWIENHVEYTPIPAGLGTCPKELPSHNPWWDGATSVMCSGLWWEDIEGGKDVTAGCTRLVERQMPAFKYSGYCRPFKHNESGENVFVKPEYSLAIFGGFPISRIVVIIDRETGEHEHLIKKAKASQLPCEVEEG